MIQPCNITDGRFPAFRRQISLQLANGSSTSFQQSAKFLPFAPSGGVKLNVAIVLRMGMEHASFH